MFPQTGMYYVTAKSFPRARSRLCVYYCPAMWVMKQRLDEIEAFLEEQTTEVTDYDEGLVWWLIEKITVYDDHLAFEF